MNNGYMRGMMGMDRANAVGGAIQGLMNGDIGGTIGNVLQARALGKMLKQPNGPTNLGPGATSTISTKQASQAPQGADNNALQQYAAKKGLSGNSVDELAGGVIPQIAGKDGSMEAMTGKGIFRNLSGNSQYTDTPEQLQKFIARSKDLNADNLGDDAYKQLQGAKNLKEATGIVDKAMAAQRANAAGGINGDLAVSQPAAKKSLFSGGGDGGGLLGGGSGGMAGKLAGAVGGAALGGVAASGLASLLSNGEVDKPKKEMQEGMRENAANSSVANALNNNTNNNIAQSAMILGLLPGQSGLLGQGMEMQDRNQQRQAAQAAAQNLKAIGANTDGGMMNGIMSNIPGTQQYGDMQRANAYQEQLAQQGIIAPSYNAWNRGGNMQGIGM